MKYFILLCILLTLSGCQLNKDISATVDATTGLGAVSQGQAAQRDLAIAEAKIVWQQKVVLGEDLSTGPCISERIIDDWVADIAHRPRTTSDDLPENQCQNYRNGAAHHFVELDPQGSLIRAE